ncbi:MAG TPA: ABC transporter substrate-binding protein [Fimbriimonadaceae bacterium]|jgi:ABC-type transport system substrate-binding protein
MLSPLASGKALTLVRLALAFAGLLVLVGCSNEPFPNAIVRGNTYVTSLDAEPASFDPTYAYDPAADQIICQIYPSFYRFHFLKRNPYQIELDLGAKPVTVKPIMVDETQPDGSTKKVKGEQWTFTFRKDLRFQDDPCFPGGKGRPVTAADVAYSFKRMADPKVNCPIASYLADKIFDFKEYADGFTKNDKQYDEEMPGVRVDPSDPYSLIITLTQPYPQLRYIMAMHHTSPQAREAVEMYGDQYGLHHTVGCGLFMMQEYRAHQDVMLVRNPNAYDERFPTDADPNLKSMLADAGKKLPFVGCIYMPILTESTTAYSLFQEGYLDELSVGSNSSAIDPVTNGLSDEMKQRGVTLHTSDNVTTYYMGFNMVDSVVGGYTPEKRKLRQAISLAMDGKTIIELNAGGLGHEAQWLMLRGIFGFDPNYKNPYRQYDPKLTRAKQLLTEAGYPNGIDPKTGQPLVLHYDCSVNSAAGRESTRLIQKMVQALGIQLEIRATSYPQFDAKVRKKQTQILGYSWFADYPDPENFAFLFYSPNAPPGPNHTSYHNPEYDRLFEQMRSMSDGPERLKIIDQMRAISVEDCPWVYTYHSQDRTMLQPWVANVLAHPMDNSQMKYVRVNPDLRRRFQLSWNRPVLWPVAVIFAIFVCALAPAFLTARSRVNRKLRAAKEEAAK